MLPSTCFHYDTLSCFRSVLCGFCGSEFIRLGLSGLGFDSVLIIVVVVWDF